MEITNNTTMPFSLYELYKETVEGKVSTNHSQLIKSFKVALSNLTEEEQSTILWDEKTFQLPNQPKPTTTIVMDKRTALWFSAKLNDSLRLAIIDKVEELTANQNKPVEPKVISAFTDEELKLLNKVSDGLLDIKDAIINSKQQPSLPQPTEEFKEALVIVEDRKEEKKLKKSFKKNTDSKYYNLKKQSIFSLRAKAPKDYKVHFKYYNDSEVIMTAIESGNTYKIVSPEWVKQMGEFLPFSALVTLRKTNKRGYLDLVKYIDS